MDSPETAPPITGPAAIAYALKRIDVEKLKREQQETLDAKKISKRPRAVAVLNILEGLKRNELTPSDLLVNRVPVLPPAFRPYSVIGESFTPGDANELYRDTFKLRDVHERTEKLLGPAGAADTRLALYDQVRALYGYADPVEPKTLQRGVSGFLKKVSGTNPKFSFFQRKMLSKPLDNVGRSVIGVDPDLELDQVGVPEEMAWRMFSPYIQARLIRTGMAPTDAVLQIKNKSSTAKRALELEVQARPVVYSRAPAWHKFSTIAGWGKLHSGKAIMINPLVTTGMNADFDGDQINLHVPSMDAAVDDAKNILMPSKMLFSNREADKVVPVPKHEMITGLFTAGHRPSKVTHAFASEDEAVKAIGAGRVSLADEINITQA